MISAGKVPPAFTGTPPVIFYLGLFFVNYISYLCSWKSSNWSTTRRVAILSLFSGAGWRKKGAIDKRLYTCRTGNE